MNYSVIIPAAGSGKRMNLGFNKVFALIDQTPIIIKTMKIFDTPNCDQIVVVYNSGDYNRLKDLINEYHFDQPVKMIEGGNERLNSVSNGLDVVASEYVLIHDGARPFLNQKFIDRILDELKQNDAVLLAVPSKDTVKVVVDGFVVNTPSRETMYLAQTPQAFKTSVIKECYKTALDTNYPFTDDASIAEYSNVKVKVLQGDYSNLKITTKEDLN